MIYRPFAIGKTFRIVPPDTPPSAESRIDLVMARGAFGSGEHETTASCLEVLEGLPEVAGAQVLDLGSGTGILAIAALKLRAAGALCIDTDPQAVASAELACRQNGVASRARHLCGTLDDADADGFDLVLANIYGDILLEVGKGLVAATRPGGTLLLSGILWEYNFAVRQHYERLGCLVLKNRMLEEFSTVLLKKRR